MIPAAFTAFTGKDHWQILLQARAIENTAYVVAPVKQVFIMEEGKVMVMQW